MRQLTKRQAKRRRPRRKGIDPSVVTKKRKYLLRTHDSLNFKVVHDELTGLPNDDNVADNGTPAYGGIRSFTFKWNDCYHPYLNSTKQPEGFGEISPDYSVFYTIGAKAIFNFDMREVAAYKLYMFTHQNANYWTSLNLTPDFTTAAFSEATRQNLQTILDEKIDKTNSSSHWLQRGDGYNSVGQISLKYSPKKFDPDRGDIVSDENNQYATRGYKWKNSSTAAIANVAASPTDNDYCTILLLPVSTEYTKAYYLTGTGNPSVTSMVWGKFSLQQIVVGVNTDLSTDVRRGIGGNSERDAVRTDAANPDPDTGI